jgi:hypothetical protein
MVAKEPLLDATTMLTYGGMYKLYIFIATPIPNLPALLYHLDLDHPVSLPVFLVYPTQCSMLILRRISCLKYLKLLPASVLYLSWQHVLPAFPALPKLRVLSLSFYLSRLVCFTCSCEFVTYLFRLFFCLFRLLFCLFRLLICLFRLLFCLFRPLFFLFRVFLCLFHLFSTCPTFSFLLIIMPCSPVSGPPSGPEYGYSVPYLYPCH